MKKEDRKFCGSFMPNIYFLLQIITVLLFVLTYLQVDDLLGFGTGGLYITFLVSAGSIGYFSVRRKEIVSRQRQHCSDC